MPKKNKKPTPPSDGKMIVKSVPPLDGELLILAHHKGIKHYLTITDLPIVVEKSMEWRGEQKFYKRFRFGVIDTFDGKLKSLECPLSVSAKILGLIQRRIKKTIISESEWALRLTDGTMSPEILNKHIRLGKIIWISLSGEGIDTRYDVGALK